MTTNCNECNQRAAAGPNYDPARRTGRTTRTLSRALVAAVAGHRVLFVSSTGHAGKEHQRAVQEMLEESGVPHLVSLTVPDRIIIGSGWIEFRAMHADLEYRGARQLQKPTKVWWDHYAEELRAIAEAKAAKAAEFAADMEQVRELMRKHDLYKIVYNATASCGTHRITK